MKTQQPIHTGKSEHVALPKAYVNDVNDYGRTLHDGKLYSASVIEKLNDTLKDKPDGRYTGSMLNLSSVNEIDGNDVIIKLNNKLYVSAISIGEGDFGDVSYLQDLENGKVYALKTIVPRFLLMKKPPIADSEKAITTIANNEMQILRDLDKGIGGFESKQNEVTRYHVIMNYVSGISGDTLIEGQIFDGKDRPPIETCLQFTHTLLKELKEIHDRGYYFVDFKPGNIQFDSEKKEAHFIDYGSAVKYDPKTRKASSHTHAAPFYEDEHRQVATTEASEVYALGLALAHCYNFITLPKFPKMPVVWHQSSFENEQDKSLYHLLKSMANPDPHLRPTLEEAINKLSSIMQPKLGADDEMTHQVTNKQEVETEYKITTAPKPHDEQQVNTQEQPNPANMQELLAMVMNKLELIPREKLSNNHQKLFQTFWTNSMMLTGGDKSKVIKSLIEYFNSQCEKYSRKHSLFSLKKYNNAVAVLNYETKEHHLTRGIGMVLKEMLDPRYEQVLKQYGVSIPPKTRAILGALEQQTMTPDLSLREKIMNKFKFK